MRSAPIILLVVSLAVSAPAQTGLLLGVQRHSATGTAYRTYWITSDAGGPHISTEFPDLVFTRGKKVWRAGVYDHSYLTCPSAEEVAEHNDWRCFRNVESTLYAVPVEQSPRIDITADDPRPIASGSDAEEQRATQTEDGDELCRTERIVLTYLDSALIGYFRRSSTTEFCEPAKYFTRRFNALVRIGEFQEPLSAGQPKRIDVLDGLSAAQKRRISRELGNQQNDGIERRSPPDSATFTIARGSGRWAILGWLEGATSRSEGVGILFDIPAPSVPVISPPVALRIKKQLSHRLHAEDYFVSEDGRFVVAIAGRRLLAGNIVGGRISRWRELASLPTDENGLVNVVMAQWSTGKRTLVLNRELQAIRLPDVEPRVLDLHATPQP